MRFYSDALLGGLHRSMAIQEWKKLGNGDVVPLERALVAFDLFVLHERNGDFKDVCIHITRTPQSQLTPTGGYSS